MLIYYFTSSSMLHMVFGIGLRSHNVILCFGMTLAIMPNIPMSSFLPSLSLPAYLASILSSPSWDQDRSSRFQNGFSFATTIEASAVYFGCCCHGQCRSSLRYISPAQHTRVLGSSCATSGISGRKASASKLSLGQISQRTGSGS